MGSVPMSNKEPKTMREPNRSQAGPAMRRINSVATKETMLELATWALVNFRSFLMVTVNNGGKVYHAQNYVSSQR